MTATTTHRQPARRRAPWTIDRLIADARNIPARPAGRYRADAPRAGRPTDAGRPGVAADRLAALTESRVGR